MTSLVTGPFYAGCLLLMAAGGQKAVRPRDTAKALRLGGLPATELTVRAAGAVEGALGAAAVVAGERWLAWAVAGSYLAFALFVLRARRSGAPLSSCGCFGKVDTPPTTSHIIINLALGGLAVAAAVWPPARLSDVIAAQPLAGLPLAALSCVTASGLFLMLGPAAQLQAVRHGGIGGRP